MRILQRVAKLVVFGMVLTWLSIAVARALLLPATACNVSQRAVDDLKLEIGYDQVREALGCDGVVVAQEEWAPKLKREVYHWRGDAWPFGRFEGLFYNGVLHGKDVRWITVNVGRTPAGIDTAGSPSSEPQPRP